MRLHRWLALGIVLAATPASADIVTSTEAGGDWSQGSTWVGGVVPSSTDDVIIAGSVAVDVSSTCNDLTVLPGGDVHNGPTGLLVLTANGSVLNQGTIRDNTFQFSLFVGGNVRNEGIWTLDTMRFTGAGDREISMDPSAKFESHLFFDAGATGDIVATTPLWVRGVVDIDTPGLRLVLDPDCKLTLEESFFAGQLQANGNTIFFQGQSAFLWDCTIDQGVLDGYVQSVSEDVYFTNGVVLNGTWQNYSTLGHSVVRISGTLENNGEIRNANTSFLSILLVGDVINNGTIRNSQIAFGDINPQAFTMTSSPTAVCQARLHLPEIIEDTLVVDAPLRTANQLGVGIGVLDLQPGCSLTFTDFAILTGTPWDHGDVLANGNEVRMVGQNCATWDINIDSAQLAGYFALGRDVLFKGNTIVEDVLVNRQFNTITATMEGMVVNEGSITENGGSFTLIVKGDLDNRGVWDNSIARIDGDQDQTIGVGPGIDVADFVLVSGIQSSSYQWTKNGVPLAGETGPELTLSGVHAPEQGVYRCEGAGGVMSRSITLGAEISDVLPGEESGTTAATLVLAQNRPNPFRDQTDIHFQLPQPERVVLSIHDASGRVVKTLVNGATIGAGQHVATWDGTTEDGAEAGSGVYFYRLEGESLTATRKLVLLQNGDTRVSAVH
ncbi:MAG: FlgD immunoglobulin-like domain containing protein [Candidatus Eisenbacteria bacterium]